MRLTQITAALAFGMALAGAQFGASPVYAGPPDDREVYEMLMRSEMLRKDRTVTRTDFIRLMEKRFDSMDKSRRGALSPEEIARILDPNFANP